MSTARRRSDAAPELPATATPTAGAYSLPAGFFVAMALLVYLGQAEGCLHHGLFSSGVYEPYADLASIPSVGGEVDPVEAGRSIYQTAGCVACHQPNGSGNPANQCPPLAGSDWVEAEGPARIIRIVLHGAHGEIVVKDQTWNSGTGMTPFGSVLSDDQIAHVLSYVRNEWGNKAPVVLPETVKIIRDKTASRTAPWTATELLKVPLVE